jgi:hypothetical protein
LAQEAGLLRLEITRAGNTLRIELRACFSRAKLTSLENCGLPGPAGPAGIEVEGNQR